MEGEKVKEIKKALQQEIHLVEYVDEEFADCVSLELLKDILTLINELESENERWKKDCADIANDYQEMAKFYDEEAQKNEELNAENKELKEETDTFNHLCNEWVKINNKHVKENQQLEFENIEFKNQLAKANNETAEKIFKKVREMLNSCQTVYEDDKYLITPNVGYLMKDVDDGLDELEKQFAVEIKE